MANDFTLNHNERLIIAGFTGGAMAHKAKKELEILGGIDVQLDRIDYLPNTVNEESIENALTSDFPGLANSVYDTEMGPDDSILMGASPDVSGMADRSANVGRDVILSILVNEDKLNEVEEVLRKYRAYF